MKRIPLLVLLSLAAAAQAAPSTYYIDYTGGNDANSGADTSHAWKVHPYMVGFSGSYSFAAGDTYVFKGGVTWPASTLPLVLTARSGTSGSRNKLTSDPAWYSGGSWVRPILDAEWSKQQCILFQGTSTSNPQSSYWNVENLECRRTFSGDQGNDGCIIFSSGYNRGADNVMITNCIVRDWKSTFLGTGGYGGGIGNILNPGEGFTTSAGGITNYVIVDCLISAKGVAPDPWAQPGSQQHGVTWAGDVIRCKFENCGNALLWGGGLWINNEFENCGGDLVGQGPNHGNIIYCAMLDGTGQHSIPSGKVRIVANNWIHGKMRPGNQMVYITGWEPQATYSGNTVWNFIFNNVMDLTGAPQNDPLNKTAVPLYTWDSENGGAPYVRVYCWNNTTVSEPTGTYGESNPALLIQGSKSDPNWQRNEFINNLAIGCSSWGLYKAVAGPAVDLSNYSFPTIAAANNAGFHRETYWAPQLGSAATIGAGRNLAGTNQAILQFNTSLGNVLTPTARPGLGSGNWDIGAHQYGAGAAPSAPVINSPLTDVAHIGSPYTYLITASGGPTTFAATPLPTGISRSGPAISGTPTAAAGSYSIGIYATNTTGVGSNTLVLDLQAAAAQIQVTPPFLNFGKVPTNTTSDLTFHITNAADASTTLSGSISVSAPFSVVSGGTYSSLAGGAGQDCVVRYTPTTVAWTPSGQATFAGGGGATNQLVGGGLPVMSSYPFPAIAGLLTNSVFSTNGGYLQQTIETAGDPTAGGAAYFAFRLTSETMLQVQCSVEATNDAQDSFFVAMDAEPVTSPSVAFNCWDVLPNTTTGAGFQTRTVHQRENGSFDSPGASNKVWTLQAGLHFVTIRGREKLARIESLTLASLGATPSPPDTPSNPNPENSAVDIFPQLTFEWTGSTNASGYFLYADMTASPTTLYATNIPTTFFDSPFLGYGKQWYWKVRATNETTGLTADSPVWSFQTQSIPAVPGNPQLKNYNQLEIFIVP